VFKKLTTFGNAVSIAGIVVTVGLTATPTAHAESAAPIYADSPEGRALIADVLAHNSELQISEVAVAQSRSVQREVRAGYLPSVDVDFRYTKLWGGLDLGSLFNPAYAALNQITGSAQFPTDISIKLPFALDTKVRLTQPLYVPQLAGAARLAAIDTRGKQIAVAITHRELVAAARKIHLGVAQTREVVAVLQTTRGLLVENLRISQLLVDTQKATQDTVLRATAQLAAHDQKLRSAQDAVRALQRQLAVLRSDANDPAAGEAPVPTAAPSALPVIPSDVNALVALAQQRRSELRGAAVRTDAAAAQAALVRQGRLPTVAVALDLGVQSSSLDASWDNKYAALSLVASWNIFDGGKRAARATQAALARQAATATDAQTRAQIAADVRTVWDHARTARDAIATIDSRIESERAAYELLNTRFVAGGVPQIEVLAAQTALISAQLERVLAVAELQQQMVELARVTEEAEQL